MTGRYQEGFVAGHRKGMEDSGRPRWTLAAILIIAVLMGMAFGILLTVAITS